METRDIGSHPKLPVGGADRPVLSASGMPLRLAANIAATTVSSWYFSRYLSSNPREHRLIRRRQPRKILGRCGPF